MKYFYLSLLIIQIFFMILCFKKENKCKCKEIENDKND